MDESAGSCVDRVKRRGEKEGEEGYRDTEETKRVENINEVLMEC